MVGIGAGVALSPILHRIRLTEILIRRSQNLYIFGFACNKKLKFQLSKKPSNIYCAFWTTSTLYHLYTFNINGTISFVSTIQYVVTRLLFIRS